MEDLEKSWTTVGSAGTLNQADLAKVTLHQSIIQLGTELLPPPHAAALADAPPAGLVNLATVQAVVRYNVTGAVAICVGIDGAVSGRMRIRGQAARSNGLSASFWFRVCHPSTLRMVI